LFCEFQISSGRRLPDAEYTIVLLVINGNERSSLVNNRIPPTAVGGSLMCGHFRRKTIQQHSDTCRNVQFDPIFALMNLEPLTKLTWAFQLHYQLCFRTYRLRSVFSNSDRENRLSAAVDEICQRHTFNLLESRVHPNHLRILVSLRPTEAISSVIRIVKANSASALISAFRLEAPIWGRGYLAQSVGRVRIESVKRYIEVQAKHHGYATRPRPPVYRFRAIRPVSLSAAHSYFELNHHLVFATTRRVGIFGSVMGKALTDYWLRVATKHGFAIDRCTFVPDHVH